MKILAAFDSFKESMTALEAGEAIRKATNHEVMIKSLADGGEGTMISLNESLKGTIHEVEVTGPLFQKVKAKLAICDDLAIIECAQACGLDLLKEEEKNARMTTTQGVGEMIVYAYNHGAKRFMITLGGSSTNDGGIGMLSALGIKFLDKNNEVLKPIGDNLQYIDHIDTSGYTMNATFIGACDVDNPLLGKNGASYIFGPQKHLEDVEKMDQDMAHYALKTKEVLLKDYSQEEGTGAAGGLGFAIITYLRGTLEPGFYIVSELTHLKEAIKEADLVITGEGKMDSQTLSGKTPYGVLKLCQEYNKKVIAFAGKVEDQQVLIEAGFDNVYCINEKEEPLSVMLEKGKENLEKKARKVLNAL